MTATAPNGTFQPPEAAAGTARLALPWHYLVNEAASGTARPPPLSLDLVADLRALVLRWRSEGRHNDAVDLEKMLSFELRVRR